MRILLIDDEASLRRTLRIALESMEHSVAEASTGDQALSGISSPPAARHASVPALTWEAHPQRSFNNCLKYMTTTPVR